MTNVIIGDSVRRLPDELFAGCRYVSQFVHLTIPPSVRYLGEELFKDCIQILDAVIPSWIDTMGVNIFSNCTSLGRVHFNAIHAADAYEAKAPTKRRYSPGALSYPNVATYTYTAILRFAMPFYDTIYIGSQVREIPSGLFGGMYTCSIDSSGYVNRVVVVNNSSHLKRIGKGAFANVLMESFDFGDSLMSIGADAFMNCRYLNKARLPEGLVSIGDCAFAGCSRMDSVWLPSSLQLIGLDCFADDSSIVYMFYDCDSAVTHSTELPESEILLASYTPFNNLKRLTSIDFGPHVRHLGEGLFSNMCGLVRVELPEGLLSVGDHCFRMITYEVQNDNPACAPAIQNGSQKLVAESTGYLFNKVDRINMKTVVLPSTLQSIGMGAFTSFIASGSPIPYILDTVCCLGSVPPVMHNYYNYHYGRIDTSDFPFTSQTFSHAVLSVPCGSVPIYQSYSHSYYAARWNSFTCISDILFDLQIIVNDTSMGFGNAICQGQNDTSTIVSCEAVAKPGFRFLNWEDGVVANPRVMNLISDTIIGANFATLYNVSLRSNFSAFGTAIGGGQYVQDSMAVITAIPNYGFHFIMWNDGVALNPRTIVVTSDTSLTAMFNRNQYVVTAQCDTLCGTITGAGTYLYEVPIMLTATANYGYHFTMWSDGVTDNPRDLIVTSDTLLTALFDRNQYVVTAQCDTLKGSIAGAGTYLYQDTVTLTATANYGYHFTMWSDGVTDNPRDLIVTSDTLLTALFDRNQYAVSVQCNSEYGTVSGSGTYRFGDMATISATANEGFRFVGWSDGVADNPRAIRVTQDTSLTAVFDTVYFTLTLRSNNPEWGTVEGSGTYVYGTEVTITAIAHEGYDFMSWSDENTDNPRTITLLDDITLTAQFAERTAIASVAEMQIKVYPNPATGIVYIDAQDVQKIELFDLGGRMLKSMGLTNSIDLGNLPEGVYYLRITSKEGCRVVKVIKK